MIELGVNIDHVATIRQARRTYEPDPVWAAAAAELGGADCITIHLREDRRHITDRDLEGFPRDGACEAQSRTRSSRGNGFDRAARRSPIKSRSCPNDREEVTTEGGLNIVGNKAEVARAIKRLTDCGIGVSMFVDADEAQIEASRELGAGAIELHTGQYALAKGEKQLSRTA